MVPSIRPMRLEREMRFQSILFHKIYPLIACNVILYMRITKNTNAYSQINLRRDENIDFCMNKKRFD